MSRLIILGTSWAVPVEGNANTHMAIEDEDGVVLIDCPGAPSVRLAHAGISFDQIHDVILTHFHPDHVGGVPLLLMNMWMLGRETPLKMYGSHHCLERVENMMGFFHWDSWPRFFPISFHRLPDRERISVLEKRNYRIFCSPVRHVIPTIGLRIESTSGGKVISYSCDTEPCPSMARLAAGSEVLIHEATGAIVGHSSASQAGAIAREAGVDRLVLIHYKAGKIQVDELIDQAKETFSGDVVLAEDFMQIDF